MRKLKGLYCNQPDRDVPGIICGYPLPCLWHTVAIHLGKPAATIEIPTTARSALAQVTKLREVADALNAPRRKRSIVEQIADMERRQKAKARP